MFLTVPEARCTATRIRIPGATPAEDYFLAVPPLHPDTPRFVRVQVLELVLRRLFCEALELAESTAQALDGRDAAMARTRALMGPGKNSWELGAAA